MKDLAMQHITRSSIVEFIPRCGPSTNAGPFVSVLCTVVIATFFITSPQGLFAKEPSFTATSCGVTRGETRIAALLPAALLDLEAPQLRAMIVMQAEGTHPQVQNLRSRWQTFQQRHHETLAVGLIPTMYPDGPPKQPVVYPPTDRTAYSDPVAPEAIYVWRYLGNLGPDLVIVVRPGVEYSWNDGAKAGESQPSEKPRASDNLAAALRTHAVAGVGRIPAIDVQWDGEADLLSRLVSLAEQARSRQQRLGPDSAKADSAKAELLRRLDRSPIEVAEQLSQVYGHKLPSVAYIPSLALVGRLRLGELTGDMRHLHDVERIVAPYRNGEKSSLGARPSGSTLSGHLIFSELSRRTNKPEYLTLVRRAADLGFDDGQLREAMPFHHEMSDAVFMGTPILTEAGSLSGEDRYFRMAARHHAFMRQLNLRDDGLHRHSPLDPANTAWGRGNGFPALGLAWTLSALPENEPLHARMLSDFHHHIDAMLQHQDEMGMWHQVVDHPESYREFTVTCMTTFAITRGLRKGWLRGDKYEAALARAWPAIKRRIGPQGVLSDVCTGTGKQKSFRDYLDRTAILGTDDRGGAMALMVATEIALYERP